MSDVLFSLLAFALVVVALLALGGASFVILNCLSWEIPTKFLAAVGFAIGACAFCIAICWWFLGLREAWHTG